MKSFSFCKPLCSSAFNNPLGPSTQILLASLKVGANIAHWVAVPSLVLGFSITLRANHSAPVLVFPQPRPERISQMNHSPSGSCCSGLPINHHGLRDSSLIKVGGWESSHCCCSAFGFSCIWSRIDRLIFLTFVQECQHCLLGFFNT